MNVKTCNCADCIFKNECAFTNDLSNDNLSNDGSPSGELSMDGMPLENFPVDPISKLFDFLKKRVNGDEVGEDGDEGGTEEREDGKKKKVVRGANAGKGDSEKRKSNIGDLQKYSEYLRNDPSLREFAEMLGRGTASPDDVEYEEEVFYETIVTPEWKVYEFDKANIVGLRESDDISAMLPSETALLSDPDLELLFYKKFAEKKLQTFDYTAPRLGYREERRAKTRMKVKMEKRGPIILCVDTSGSMEGKPEKVAKALTLALLAIALEEKRKFYLITFTDRVKTLELSDMNQNSEKLLNFLSYKFSGGTDAVPAIKKSLRLLLEKDYAKADVVMVSDFEMEELSDYTVKNMRKAKANKTKFHSLNVMKSKTKLQSLFGVFPGLSKIAQQAVVKEFDYNWIYDSFSWNSVIKAA